MFSETLITIIIAIAIVGAIWLIYGRFVTPVRAGKGEKLYALLYAQGDVPDLSRTVGALQWLLNSGRIDMEILIADGGLDGESRKMAELLARDGSSVKLCRANELDKIITEGTEDKWRKRSSSE